MICFRLKNTELCLDFSFFAAIAIFAFFDNTGTGLASIVMCMLHELAHLVVMAILDVTPERIKFYGAGIAITARSLDSRRSSVRAAVYSAGCLLNLVLAIAFFLFGNRLFSAINLCICALNLLPFGELDGARLLILAAEHFFEPYLTDKLMKICGAASVVICVVIFVSVKGRVSISALISGVYILILSVIKRE
ncbi:MAG: hypothetical protein ACI4KM_12325 [Oscillospiraceae bacterium]